jgi:Rps23 Pro-64 3,4-dihydroxylase Tpa1-like proline 4-hydroxylase
MMLINGQVILDQETFLLNTLAVGIAVQILEKETVFSKEEWQVFLQQNAQEQYNSMSANERIIFINALVEQGNRNENQATTRLFKRADNSHNPKPDWDYYRLWHILQQAKLEIDSSLKLLSETEENNDYVNETVVDSMNKIGDFVADAKEII